MFPYLVFDLLLGVYGIVEIIHSAGRQPSERQNQLTHAASNLALAFGAWEAHAQHVRLAWVGLAAGIGLLIVWVAGVYAHSLHNTVM